MKQSLLKIIGIVLIISMFFSLCGCFGNKDKDYSKMFSYKLDDKNETCIINKYIGDADKVEIPEKIEYYDVVAISTNAFANNTIIKEVTVPDSVTLLEKGCFSNCIKLEKVNFGKGIVEIKKNAFYNCTSLKEINLPKKLERLGDRAFFHCVSAKRVTVPKTLKKWGMTSFANCSSLEEIELQEGIETIGEYATFMNCDNVKEITIPASVKDICDAAFFCNHGSLKTVNFLGNAPKVGVKIFGAPNKDIIVKYKENTSGWENSSLGTDYTLKSVK